MKNNNINFDALAETLSHQFVNSESFNAEQFKSSVLNLVNVVSRDGQFKNEEEVVMSTEQILNDALANGWIDETQFEEYKQANRANVATVSDKLSELCEKLANKISAAYQQIHAGIKLINTNWRLQFNCIDNSVEKDQIVFSIVTVD